MEDIKLYYFLVGSKATIGRGENVKLLLEDAGLKHEYIRLTFGEAWNKKKQELVTEGFYANTLPYTEINGKKFGKTVPIMRYVSVKLGRKYHGSNAEEDQLLDCIADVSNDWYESMRVSFWGSDDDKVKHAKVETPKFLTTFERFYSMNEGPYILGDKISYVDFIIYHLMDDDTALNRLADCPNLAKFTQVFLERPNIKKYLATLSA